MHARAAQHDPYTGTAGIDLGHHLRLLVRGAAHHEDDDVLRFVTGMAPALEEGVLQFLEPAFDEVLEGGFEAGRMLRVDVFDALEGFEAVAGAAHHGGEEGGGFEEVGESSCDGGGLEGVVVGEELGDDADALG